MHFPKIVIVDDDDAVRSVIVALVQEAMPSALIVDYFSSLHALREVETGSVHLLITNFEMADINGGELVRAIRREKNAIPIIMVSGRDEAREVGEAAGVDLFIPKYSLTVALKEAVLSLLKSP